MKKAYYGLGAIKILLHAYIVAIRKNEEIRHTIYLTAEQMIEYAYPSPEAELIDINVKAKDRDRLIESQTLESLIDKLKA